MKRDDLAAARVPTRPRQSPRDADDDVDTDRRDHLTNTDTTADPDVHVDRDDDVDTDRRDDPDDYDDPRDTDALAETDRRDAAEDPDDYDDPRDTDALAEEEEPAELDDRGRQILAFEKQWWRQAGSKEQAIRDTFGLSATHYYQLLNTLLDNPLALAHDPIVVQRLRRLRASRTRHR